MNLYAESSAILCWILGEQEGARVYPELAGAGHIVTSDLTLLECERALIRLGITGKTGEVTLADRRLLLADVSSRWHILPMEDEVLQRARLSFPKEPVRTMDAIHLASALIARSALQDLALLSVDHRVRLNGRRLGFKIIPR
jgi:hypothetical protein